MFFSSINIIASILQILHSLWEIGKMVLKRKQPQVVAACPSGPPDREPRLWTIEAYQGLTEDLVGRFGPQALMCANFRALDIDPSAILNSALDQLDDMSGEEDTRLWLKGILAGLISVWAYVKKIRQGRIYRLVLRRFIILALLMEALHLIMEGLTAVIEALIRSMDDLEELQRLLSCPGEANEQKSTD